MGGAPCIIQVMDDHDLVLKHGDVGIAYDLRSLHIIVDWLVQSQSMNWESLSTNE